MTDDLLQAVRDLPRVSRYLHVPAQSGCDEVLKRMKRMYTAAAYEEMLARHDDLIPALSDRITVLHRGGSVTEEAGALYRELAESAVPLSGQALDALIQIAGGGVCTP